MKWILGFGTFLFSTILSAAIFTASELNTLKSNFMENIKENGAIIASPSQEKPNYYYDWIRDSAIAMGLVASWFDAEQDPHYKNLLFQYVDWVEKTQQQSSPNAGSDILGEPKFYLDGRPYDGPWGRPQNDGPALRALAQIQFARSLLKNSEITYVQTHLYHGGVDPRTMGTIKMDLEYIAHHWKDKNFDLWEEVYAHHFFTGMVQRKALLEGAALARDLDDIYAAMYYEAQAAYLENRLMKHIHPFSGIIQASSLPHEGPQKYQELDSAVILGVLLGNHHDTFFAVDNPYLAQTIAELKDQFKQIFPINDQYNEVILFGRYPGDTYDGYHTNGEGNPWFILTAAMAEYHYTLAQKLSHRNETQPHSKHHLLLGDEYLRVIKQYAPNLRMNEQINRYSGKQQGAASLTWSYVALLRAVEARKRVAGFVFKNNIYCQI